MSTDVTVDHSAKPGDAHGASDQKADSQAAAKAADKMRDDSQVSTLGTSTSRQEPTHLVMTDAFATATQASDRTSAGAAPQLHGEHGEQREHGDASSLPTNHSAQPADASGRQHWTVAIELGSSESHDGVQQGGDRQSADLQRLAAQTAGTDVTLVVQATHADRNSPPGPNGGPPGTLDRYVIRNGQIEALPSEASHGAADDTRSLLHLAGQAAPSDRIALISQGHGRGTDGVTDDTGHASLPELQQAIKDGLAGSGHDHLDVLDFDRCLMGAAGVESAFHGLADHIVGSEEIEANHGAAFDGQTLSAPIADLLHNPQMTPAQLADDFVRRANGGANGTPVLDESNGPTPHSGTDTLAHFDSSQYQQFAGRLGALGTALTTAAADPATRQQIEGLIAATPAFPNGHTTEGDDERDLRSFAERIITASQNGSLNDKDRAIAHAAQQLLESQGTLTGSYHGDAGSTGYDRMGGLSVFLPHGTTGDITHAGTALSYITGDLAPDRAEQAFSNKQALDRDIDAFMHMAQMQHLSTQATADLDRLKASQQQLAAATTHDQFMQAFRAFGQVARSLNGGSLDREETADFAPFARSRRATQVEQSRIEGADGWNAFIQSLAS